MKHILSIVISAAALVLPMVTFATTPCIGPNCLNYKLNALGQDILIWMTCVVALIFAYKGMQMIVMSLRTDNLTHTELNSVSSVSKYLTMVLFVALPFIGGWMGYMYMPEKVVVVEKVIVREVQVPTQDSADIVQNVATIEDAAETPADMVVDPQTAKVGDTFGNFIIEEIIFDDWEGVYITFGGSEVVTGTISPSDMFGPGIRLNEASVKLIPAIKIDNEIRKPGGFEIRGPLVEALPSAAINYMAGKNQRYSITAEIKNYRFVFAPKESTPGAELVQILELIKI